MPSTLRRNCLFRSTAGNAKYLKLKEMPRNAAGQVFNSLGVTPKVAFGTILGLAPNFSLCVNLKEFQLLFLFRDLALKF